MHSSSVASCFTHNCFHVLHFRDSCSANFVKSNSRSQKSSTPAVGLSLSTVGSPTCIPHVRPVSLATSCKRVMSLHFGLFALSAFPAVERVSLCTRLPRTHQADNVSRLGQFMELTILSFAFVVRFFICLAQSSLMSGCSSWSSC